MSAEGGVGLNPIEYQYSIPLEGSTKKSKKSRSNNPKKGQIKEVKKQKGGQSLKIYSESLNKISKKPICSICKKTLKKKY